MPVKTKEEVMQSLITWLAQENKGKQYDSSCQPTVDELKEFEEIVEDILELRYGADYQGFRQFMTSPILIRGVHQPIRGLRVPEFPTSFDEPETWEAFEFDANAQAVSSQIKNWSDVIDRALTDKYVWGLRKKQDEENKETPSPA